MVVPQIRNMQDSSYRIFSALVFQNDILIDNTADHAYFENQWQGISTKTNWRYGSPSRGQLEEQAESTYPVRATRHWELDRICGSVFGRAHGRLGLRLAAY